MKQWQRTAKTVGLFLLISCALATEAAAQDVTVMGAGADASCGKWLSERQQGRFSDLSQWALGYLSGVAMWSDEYDPVKDQTADAVYGWLDNYCRAHPTTEFVDAVDAFAQK
jgi:hypothetical protein